MARHADQYTGVPQLIRKEPLTACMSVLLRLHEPCETSAAALFGSNAATAWPAALRSGAENVTVRVTGLLTEFQDGKVSLLTRAHRVLMAGPELQAPGVPGM